ncbi:MAG: glycosyltransferase family 2 protein [Clostridia bacterium]|nr:glycosyltransferase family 2 protein [Clostridia bacterium]
MPHYKIYVYAICKNEEQFVDRWVASMSEADGIFVLDTGSTDGTVEKLTAYPNVTVTRETVAPWRFDTARNRSLEPVLPDADLCVCTDLDEVFVPGWRQGAEAALATGAQQLRYRYIWSFTADGREGTVFFADKMHARQGFIWTHPVHEVLAYTGGGRPVIATAQGVQLNHYPDQTKSRGGYLPLLELAVRENPQDARDVHYLGREYLFAGRYDEAIAMLRRHLSLPGAVWDAERCASMRYIARCYAHKGDAAEAERWLLRACAEAPRLRGPWMELARSAYEKEDWHAVIFAAVRALAVPEADGGYMYDAADYAARPHDLLSLAYYHTGDKKSALSHADKALTYEPDNERLKRNRTFFES